MYFRRIKIYIFLVSEDGLFFLLNKIFCDYEVFDKRNEFFLIFYLFFRYNLENDIERGGIFVVYYRGELVVNIWGGYVDRKVRVKWKRDMMLCFYFIIKFLLAAVIVYLVDR